MTKIVLRVTCPVPEHDHTLLKPTMTNVTLKRKVRQIDEGNLRKILALLVAEYVANVGCSQPRSWIDTAEDIGKLKLRRGAELIGFSDRGGRYLPAVIDGNTCLHCGWYRLGVIARKQGTTFCERPTCQNMALQRSAKLWADKIQLAKDAGRCIYRDTASYPGNEYCTNPNDVDSDYCSTHRVLRCWVCGEQANYTQWIVGKQPYPYPRCNKH
jgi:hypothetical protein